MNVAVFSSQPYDRQFLGLAHGDSAHHLTYFEPRLTPETAALAAGYEAVCVFINDDLNAATLKAIATHGTQFIVLRSAGYNNVDLSVAKKLGLKVVRVPAYSPYAVAEHAVALILTLNRKIYRAYNRVRDDNFMLTGLLGFDLHGSTVGIIGTGKIGQCFAQIMNGFGCHLLAFDPYPNDTCLALGVEYVPLEDLLHQSDVVSLHCPLIDSTYHLINEPRIQMMKPGAMLINTSRGGLIDTPAVINGIKAGIIGYLGIDVYELEADLFFADQSENIIQDDCFQLLQSFSNVIITAHQGFFTQNALTNIAQTTRENLDDLAAGRSCKNEVIP